MTTIPLGWREPARVDARPDKPHLVRVHTVDSDKGVPGELADRDDSVASPEHGSLESIQAFWGQLHSVCKDDMPRTRQSRDREADAPSLNLIRKQHGRADAQGPGEGI